MPKIPTYQETNVPAVRPGVNLPLSLAKAGAVQADPEALTSSGRGKANLYLGQARAFQAQAESFEHVARAMDQVQAMGESLFRTGTRLFETAQTSRLNEAQAKAQDELTQTLAGLEDLQDETDDRGQTVYAYQRYQPVLRERVKEIRERYSKGLVGPWAARFYQAFDSNAVRADVRARDLALTKARDHFAGSLQESMAALERQYAGAGSPGERQQVLDQLGKKLDDGVKLGMLSRQDRARLSLAFKEKASSIEVVQALRVDPKGTLERLKDAENWPNLDPERRQRLIELAENEADKQALETAYADLRIEAQKSGYGPIVERLKSPEFYQGLGLDLGQARSLITIFRAEKEAAEAAARKAQAAAEESTTHQVYQLWNTALISGDPQDMKKAVQFAMQAPNIKPTVRHQIVADMVQGLTSTDNTTWGNAVLGINSGHINTAEDLLKAGVKGDKIQEGLNLIKSRNKDNEPPEGTNYFNQAVTEYDRQVRAWYPEEAKRAEYEAKRGDFVLALNRQMQKNGLRPNDPEVWDLAKKLMEPVVTESGLWSETTKRRFQIMTEQPWIKDQDVWGEKLPVNLAQEEDALKLLQEKNLPDTPANRYWAFEALKRGRTDQMPPHPWPDIPPEAQDKIRNSLAAKNKLITPETIRQVWEDNPAWQAEYYPGYLY